MKTKLQKRKKEVRNKKFHNINQIQKINGVSYELLLFCLDLLHGESHSFFDHFGLDWLCTMRSVERDEEQKIQREKSRRSNCTPAHLPFTFIAFTELQLRNTNRWHSTNRLPTRTPEASFITAWSPSFYTILHARHTLSSPTPPSPSSASPHPSPPSPVLRQ